MHRIADRPLPDGEDGRGVPIRKRRLDELAGAGSRGVAAQLAAHLTEAQAKLLQAQARVEKFLGRRGGREQAHATQDERGIVGSLTARIVAHREQGGDVTHGFEGR